MNLYRAQFGRLLALDERIRAGKYPNCSSFAREWEVSEKTVQRDVEFLRDNRGAPVEYDAVHKGFVYSDPSWRLAPLELTEGELLQLVVAERMAAEHRGAPIAATLNGLFEKLRAALPEKTRIDPIDVHARFSFHGQPVREVAPAVWRTVARALRDHRVLRVTYRSFGATAAKVRDLEPVHLTSLAGEWALVARMRGREELLLFSLSRMQKVTVTKTSSLPIDFDPSTYFENRFGRFIGERGDVHEISVLFSSDVAAGVLERTWHPKQTVEKRKDGSIVLRFPAPSLYEIQRWVLQWGGEAKVLEPPELRAAVSAEANRMRSLYFKKSSQSPPAPSSSTARRSRTSPPP
jgi:predicted DNA-binding transcriptional regulator YafY